MKKSTTLILITTLALSACAKGPDAIAPVPMGNAFQSLTCAEAQTALNGERATLSSLEARQRSAAAGDAIGVFLILVPLSSVAGYDVAGELGASKGRVIAYENRLATC